MTESSSVTACGEFLPLSISGVPLIAQVPRKTRKSKKQEVLTINTLDIIE